MTELYERDSASPPTPDQLGRRNYDQAVRDPELEPQTGVWAADGMSLRFAAEAGLQQFGVDLVLPPEAIADPAFADLTEITIEGLKVTAIIDTGFLKWKGEVAKELFTDYKGEVRQAAQIQTPGYVALVDGTAVSCAPMRTEDGKEYYLWVSETPSPDESNPTRYGLLRNAQSLIAGYGQAVKEGEARQYTARKIPAVSADWSSPMPEIVEANIDTVDEVEQTVKLRLDYTGARAAAKTVIVYRGFGGSESEYAFGQRGPVTYWFTSKDGQLPFAVCRTTSKAWLTLDQSPDFDFSIDK